MRDKFHGYFTPSAEEFIELWRNCVFGFDANVLLGVYRSTAHTQNVFFNVLEKVKERIFLPHQAASEYLRNRLTVISIRSDQYEKIKGESQKFSTLVESIVQEHAILNGDQITQASKTFAEQITQKVHASLPPEPDLLRSDEILARLADLFKSSTGAPYSQERQKEIYAEGAQRYAQSIPPGYKGDKKGEPGKYGDLLIWYQLIDYAKAVKKPLIFITGDVKEDWLQQHRKETLGPRPELRQEMMAASGFTFWMYTTPRFLEFAKQYLGLRFDTKQAESEFEKIEKQTNAVRFTPDVSYYYFPATDLQDFFSRSNDNLAWDSNFATLPVNFRTTPANIGPKQEFLQLLALNGVVFNPPTGKWTCKIVAAPADKSNDRVSYTFDCSQKTIQCRIAHLGCGFHSRRLKRTLIGATRRPSTKSSSDG